MRLSLLALFALCVPDLAAHADTITTFSADGTFDRGATLGGTVNIDTTTGAVTGGALTVSPLAYTFSLLEPYQGYNSGYGGYVFFFKSSFGDYLTLLLPETSLVNYTGSFLASESMPSSTDLTSSYMNGEELELNSGALTTTPEPSSLILLGSGIVGAASVLRRRRLS